jgi:hypothetical protein
MIRKSRMVLGSRVFGSALSSRPRSHAACPRHVGPPWQRQDGANLQGKAGERLPESLHYSLRKFHCATCAVSKRTRRYRRSKRVKVAAAKRATQARTLRTRKPSADVVLNRSKNAKHAGEQEAQKQDSGTAIK